MARQKFTIIQMPDQDGYQSIVPHYYNIHAWGKTPEETLENTRLTLESVLEEEGKKSDFPVPYNVRVSHVLSMKAGR